MTVPDENREDILEGLAYIALIPIEDAEIKEHIAKLVASVALQIGGEPFMMDLNKKTRKILDRLIGRGGKVQ